MKNVLNIEIRNDKLKKFNKTNIELLKQAVHYAVQELINASYTYKKFNSTHEGWAILKEEVDEMWDEIKNNEKDLAREEAIQVAAMALRYLMDC